MATSRPARGHDSQQVRAGRAGAGPQHCEGCKHGGGCAQPGGQAQASDRQPWIWSTHCWADGTSWAQKL